MTKLWYLYASNSLATYYLPAQAVTHYSILQSTKWSWQSSNNIPKWIIQIHNAAFLIHRSVYKTVAKIRDLLQLSTREPNSNTTLISMMFYYNGDRKKCASIIMLSIHNLSYAQYLARGLIQVLFLEWSIFFSFVQER